MQMNYVLKTILIFFLSLTIYSCTEESTTYPIEDLVITKIDLQTGFEGHHVIIEFNNEVHFNAILSEAVPFSGPLATFSTYLPRENNHLYIAWTLNYPFLTDSIDIFLGSSDKYFIGIRLNGEEIEYEIQESEFLYL
jgi:hypothetical protein